MPTYDYRCKDCGHRFSLFYKTYASYDAARPACPQCGSTDLAHLITGVAVQRPTRDYSNMSPDEMLSVLESGDSRQVGEMFRQVGGDDPELGPEFHEATDRLLKGDSLEEVEQSLEDSESEGDT